MPCIRSDSRHSSAAVRGETTVDGRHAVGSTSMSNSQRKRERLAASRLRRAKQMQHIDPCNSGSEPPDGAVLVDPAELAHNNTYGALPRFYLDRIVTCRDCAVEEVWPACRQKWWYETAKGDINTVAVYCRGCRKKRKAIKEQARAVHLSGVAAKRTKGAP